MDDQPMMESLPEKLTDEEKRDFGLELARQIEAELDLEDQKKSVTAELTAQIKIIKKRIAQISRTLSQGFQIVEAPVLHVPHKPHPGLKEIRRLDGSVIRTERMSAQELQSDLPFEQPVESR